MQARKDDTPDAQERRRKLRDAIAFKAYEFDAHGVDMNQRYLSDAVIPCAGERHVFTEDAELVYQTTCMAGIRLPHVWLVKQRQNSSSLDVVGKGRFTLLTGIGGEGWRSAADAVRATLGVPVVVTTIGPDCDYEDPFGDWARSRCVEDDGAVLVRPDQFVAWRAKNRDGDQAAILLAVFRKLLARNV